MCEWGTDVTVTCPAGFSGTNEARTEVPVDECIAAIVAALNAGGVLTIASCCGHGNGPGRIDLQHGGMLEIHKRTDPMTTTPNPDTSAEELLPCPFCGADAVVFEDDHSVGCTNCPASIDYGSEATPENVTRWNRRAPALSDGLREALEQIVALEPQPYVMPPDWHAQIDACKECQGWAKNHPIQRGICDTHRKPLWERESHDDREVRRLGYRAKEIARAALAPKEGQRT